MFEYESHRGARLEGQFPGEHLIKDHPEAVEIGAGIEFLALCLFGRHILRRADDHSLLSEIERIVALGSQLRYREVEHFDLLVRSPILDEKNIIRLQVAMDDVIGMGRVDRIAGLPHYLDCPLGRESPFDFEDLAKTLA